MGSIFISYRRAGTSGYGGRLQEDLRDHFGRERVFRDIDSIRPGSDFAQVIGQAVAQSGIVLALIGRNWLAASNAKGERRLDDPDDFVRLEIESALALDIVVVPVLVEGATVPSPGELPPSISRLGRTQAIELSDERWDYDIERLVTVLEEVVGPPVALTSDQAAAVPAPTRASLVAWRGRAAARAARAHGADPTARGTAPDAVTAAMAPVGEARPGPDSHGRGAAGGAAGLAAAGVVEQDGPTGRRRSIVAGVAAVALVVLIGVLATVARSGEPPVIVSGAKVVVPAVVDLDAAGAETAIEGAGLVADLVPEPHESVAAGTVFLQAPEAAVEVERGSTVTVTVSMGATTSSTGATTDSTTGPAPTAEKVRPTTTTAGPGPQPTTGPVPSTAPPTPTAPPVATTVALPLLSTGNLVANPGAEDSGASAPFSVGQPPAGWRRGAHQAIAADYGARGSRSGCSDAGYPSVGELAGSGQRLFTGGYDAGGGCGLAAGSVPTLTQVVSLAPYAGRTDGVGWAAGARLASYPGSGDGAELTVEVLGAGGQVLASTTTGMVSNPSGSSAFQTRSLGGRLPSGAASVRLTLSFFATAFSGGFADEVSFRLG